jgi:NAD(P)-dependent dehydrogenase (short-subunit alcohol dehydrogenase family)
MPSFHFTTSARTCIRLLRHASALTAAAALATLLPATNTFAQGTPEAASMKGKTVLITGSTDGLGRDVAGRVAALGAHVIVHGRNQERGKTVVDDITRQGKGSARFYAADLSSMAEVRAFAEAIRRDYKRIDVLVNNAGVLLKDRQTSPDGYEMHFAVNYLAPFLLTRTLLPTLTGGAPSRIINVSSVAQSPIDFDDVMLERPGRGGQGYGQSKLAILMFTMDLARELQSSNVVVTALHPATMMDTSMVRQSGMQARSTVAEGSDALMHLIVGTDVTTGQYYNGLKPAKGNAQAYDEAAQARLRELSVKLTAAGR